MPLRSLRAKLKHRALSSDEEITQEEQITREDDSGAEGHMALNVGAMQLRDRIQKATVSLRHDGLCTHCCDLVGEAICSQVDVSSRTSISRHYDKDRKAFLISTCRLCRFMGGLKAQAGGHGGRIAKRSIYSLNPHLADYDLSTSRALFTFQTNYNYWYGSSIGEGTFGLLHSEFACDNIRPRLIRPSSIDFSIVLEWLRFCELYHSDTCSSLAGEEVYGMKVIDCQTRRVIKAEKSFRYVALSYVWGTAVSREMDDGVFPTTIEDSILVTMQIGYRYLWVDKYCIDQEDANKRHHQILNMDKIYSMASLTIIVAAGQNPDYGLPGVSSRSREPQRNVKLSTTTLVEIFSGVQDIRESAWASRAWTLQEGFLPRRRLIFTDHEVSFLCDCMYCQESVEQKLVHREKGAWDGQDGSHLFGVIPNRNRQQFHTEQILSEYTGRNLSFAADTLNACLGILKAARILHYQGIPIERDPKSEESFLNLQWANRKSNTRQPGFPTWSWTSTAGQKIFPEVKGVDCRYPQIRVPSASDRWQSVNQWMVFGDDTDTDTDTDIGTGTDILPRSQCLQITALIGNPRFVEKSWLESNIGSRNTLPSGEGPFILLRQSKTVWSVFRVHLDCREDSIHSLSHSIALLLHRGGQQVPRTYPVMLVLKCRGAYYHRVGITDWTNEWRYEYNYLTLHDMMVGKKTWQDFNERNSTEKPDLVKLFEEKTIYLE